MMNKLSGGTAMILLSLFILITGCRESGDKAGNQDKQASRKISDTIESRKLASFKETPAFIREYLGSDPAGRFQIADSGERWNAGCIGDSGCASRKFVSAEISHRTYKLRYLVGGIATTEKTLTIDFEGNLVKRADPEIGW